LRCAELKITNARIVEQGVARDVIEGLSLGDAAPRQITTVPGANNMVPSWSRDGQWVYFASRGGGKDFQVWKVPIRGGSAVQMTKKGGFAPLEADDGYLYYAKGFSIPGIWKVPSHGGTEVAVLELIADDHTLVADLCKRLLKSDGMARRPIPCT
jgi:hypothetical protein